MFNNLRKIHPAVISVWAAVIATGHLIPVFPIFGTGGNFSFAHIFNPLSGIFFGPVAGVLCSSAGGFIGNFIAPNTMWMGPFNFILGAATAFTSGCIAWGKAPPVSVNFFGNFIINGGIIVYIIGTILWFTQDVGRSLPVYPLVVYGLGFTALIAGSFFVSGMFANKNHIWKFPAIWLCAFGGLIGGATIGNFFYLIIVEPPKEYWYPLVFITPFERALFSLGATLVGVPLLSGLNKIGIRVGPQSEEERHEN